jgi:hypothetical protein
VAAAELHSSPARRPLRCLPSLPETSLSSRILQLHLGAASACTPHDASPTRARRRPIPSHVLPAPLLPLPPDRALRCKITPPSRSNLADWPTPMIPRPRVLHPTLLGPATAVSALLQSIVRPSRLLLVSFVHSSRIIEPLSNPALVSAVVHDPFCSSCPSHHYCFFLLARLSDMLRLLHQATTCHISSTTVCARSLASWSEPVNVCLCALWYPSLA